MLRLTMLERRACAECNKLLFGSPFDHGQGQQQHPPEANFAIFGGVPLGLGVRAAAVSSRAQRQSRNAQRERDIGVCRAQTKIGAQAQMPVHGAQSVEERRVAGQLRCGTVADLGDGEGQQLPCSARLRSFTTAFGSLDGVFNGAVQGDLKTQ